MRKVWNILAATLIGITAFAVGGCKRSVRYDNYAYADLYQLGGASFAAERVQAVEIDWLGGNVEIEQNTAGKVEIIEEEGITKEEERMRYYFAGSTLKIQYCASGVRVQETEKNLRVSLPPNVSLDVDCVSARVNVLDSLELKALSIESVSGNIEVERVLCDGEVEIETVSGAVEILELTADGLSVDTTSGNVSVQKLSVQELDADTTSGALLFGVQKALTGEIESVSGSVKIKLLDGLGANLTIESASGELKTQKSYEKTGKTYVFSAAEDKGTCALKIETFSASVTVE